jgi:hypothetical protein
MMASVWLVTYMILVDNIKLKYCQKGLLHQIVPGFTISQQTSTCIFPQNHHIWTSMFMMSGMHSSYRHCSPNMKNVKISWFSHTATTPKRSISSSQSDERINLQQGQNKNTGATFVTNAAGNIRRMGFYVSTITFVNKRPIL